ncbi:hypothetical protein QBC34DRAFT_410067 [Podospora aff. communis PSN243]|uniref:Uncharacterized protein n=1 Tax=Podospora aff. communis PSN243 TaxID=3040156 RepID=A0AAV9GIG9_9PEZI|nr:hypothetical protein QBC34DRAFT_410067 [Podospora aff. communis PSN243]
MSRRVASAISSLPKLRTLHVPAAVTFKAQPNWRVQPSRSASGSRLERHKQKPKHRRGPNVRRTPAPHTHASQPRNNETRGTHGYHSTATRPTLTPPAGEFTRQDVDEFFDKCDNFLRFYEQYDLSTLDPLAAEELSQSCRAASYFLDKTREASMGTLNRLNLTSSERNFYRRRSLSLGLRLLMLSVSLDFRLLKLNWRLHVPWHFKVACIAVFMILVAWYQLPGPVAEE